MLKLYGKNLIMWNFLFDGLTFWFSLLFWKIITFDNTTRTKRKVT